MNEKLALRRLRNYPEFLDESSKWFSSKWGIPVEAYRESIEACVKQQVGIPQWYIMLDQEQNIIAGAGVIENDFHNRKDLTPNLCALYVEEAYRNRGIARDIVEAIGADLGERGCPKVYLITDHTDFYEKLGWEYLTMVTGDDGNQERMYGIDLK